MAELFQIKGQMVAIEQASTKMKRGRAFSSESLPRT